jgi:hypothetical protein
MIELRNARRLWKIGIRTRLAMKGDQCRLIFPSNRLLPTLNKLSRGAPAEMVQCKVITVI